MSRVTLLLLALALSGAVHAQRTQVSINDGWRFWNDDAPSAERPDLVDDAWQRVDLPHTWNADDAFDDEPGYRRGIGWYRRVLEVGPEQAGRRLFLFFEGANQVADVWVNGLEVGRHVGGYTAFAFDVTDAVQPGENTVAVRVDNRHDPDIPPLDADFTFYGGLYRNVWLVSTDPVHISLRDAAPNVWLRTPGLEDGDTRVRAATRLDNTTDEPAAALVTHRLFDPSGLEVEAWSSSRTLQPGGSTLFEDWSSPVADPQLYAPETPAVYRVETTVEVGGAIVDRVTNPLGFRWVEADGDGFRLNGERRLLIGTNRHQDIEGVGNAMTDAQHRRDVQIVRENGFDFLRLAHYPQARAVLEETDRLGLLVWEEIPVVNTITQSQAFGEHAERMLTEMIRQHANHPSVVMWGYMNEILLRIPNPMPSGYIEDVRDLAEQLENRVEVEDPSRLTAMAISFNEVEYRVADVADIFALNLYFGWYHDTADDLGPFLDSLYTTHPDVPLMVSEYGAGSDERIHTARPVRFDFSTEHAEEFHRTSLRTILDRPWMVGSAVWNQFDFGSAGRQDTKDGINQKGLYRYDRTPKDAAFLYRAALLDEPVIRIERDHIDRAGPRRQSVRVFTNAEQVALALEGEIVGSAVPVDGLAVLEVEFASGENRIQAVGLWGETTSADATTLHYTDTAAFFEGGPDAPSMVALNVGADHSFTGAGGLVYVAEADWPTGALEGTARRTHHRIGGTLEDARFQSSREVTTWTLPELPAGTYDVTFGLVETGDTEPASRTATLVGTAVSLTPGPRWHALERSVRITLTERSAPILEVDAPAALSTLAIQRR